MQLLLKKENLPQILHLYMRRMLVLQPFLSKSHLGRMLRSIKDFLLRRWNSLIKFYQRKQNFQKLLMKALSHQLFFKLFLQHRLLFLLPFMQGIKYMSYPKKDNRLHMNFYLNFLNQKMGYFQKFTRMLKFQLEFIHVLPHNLVVNRLEMGQFHSDSLT